MVESAKIHPKQTLVNGCIDGYIEIRGVFFLCSKSHWSIVYTVNDRNYPPSVTHETKYQLIVDTADGSD